MDIVVNGERRAVAEALPLEQFLAELRLDPRLVVVEYNRRILKRPELGGITLKPADQLEIVRIVGGGSG